MAGQRIINIGNQSNDGNGDSIRDAFNKVNENFNDIYNLVGAGNGFSFLSLNEAPTSLRASNSNSGQVTVLGINEYGTKILNKTMVAGTGMQLVLYDDLIIINSTSSNLSSESSPVLGGNLDGRNAYNLVNIDNNAPHHDYDAVSRKWVYDNFINRDGDTVYDTGADKVATTFASSSTIRQNVQLLVTPTTGTHIVNKTYADSKISLAGTATIDTFSGLPNPAMGTMTGALILFRDPIDTDHPSQAATKNYVDGSSFVSEVNFFVSLSGNDNRFDIPSRKKGRGWSYAFKTINQACQAAEASLNASQITLGPYQKTITVNNNQSYATISSIGSPTAGVLDSSQYGINLIISVPYNEGTTDAYANGSLFPGCFIVGARSGATALLERITHPAGGTTGAQESYDLAPVDYASTFQTDLQFLSGTTASTVTYAFVTPNLIGIPDFWTGYTFKQTDISYNVVSLGTILSTGYYTDTATGYVYDTITIDFTQGIAPTTLGNIINNNWHVYSGFSGTFDLGEELIWGQYQPKTQITINIESGEHEDQYPIRVPNNVSLKGDEFRRTVVKPGKLYNTQLSSISDSKWAQTKFFRDTQIDAIIPVQLNTATNYVDQLLDPNTNAVVNCDAHPSGTTNDASTGVLVFSIYETANTAQQVNAPASWVGKVFVGGGGKGIITAVVGNTFSVDLAENDTEHIRELTNSGAIITHGSWAVYDPINYGFHYLRDARYFMNVLTTQTNNGGFLNAAGILAENKKFIQDEIEGWFKQQFSYSDYYATLCRRDAGTIIDGLVSDLTTGGWSRTVNNGDSIVNFVTGLTTACVSTIYQIGNIAYNVLENTTSTAYNSYRTTSSVVTFNNYSNIVNVTTATANTVQVGWTIIDNKIPSGFAEIIAVNTASQTITINTEMVITPRITWVSTSTFIPQTIDLTYSSEANSYPVLVDLVQACARIVKNDPKFNPPKYNDQMDVFLMNDSTMIRYMSCQGHGGFMKVLDPAGQILAKSPYTQTASSFSKSLNRHVFSGGMFVDGFSGNVTATPDPSASGYPNATIDTTGLPTKIPVYGLGRPNVDNTSTFVRPQTPCFFVNAGITYEIDFISEFNPVTNYGILNLNPSKPGGVYSVSGVNISGFKHNASVPVTFSSPQAPGGLTATGVATTDNSGNITAISITFPGVGYESAPTYTLGGAVLGFSYTGSGGIAGYSVAVAGSGYVVGTSINFNTPGGGSSAVATVATVDSNGGILTINITNAGSGYSASSSPATVTFGTINNLGTVTTKIGYLGNLPANLTLVTAGNRSMLANDFTQLNDLGYGIFATNGGFIENVSMFTYYCHTSYYALNGAQLRTITGSSAYGDYGLVSEGSNPTEVPIPVVNKNPMTVVGTIYNTGSYITVSGDATVYVDVVQNGYIPQLQSKIDINQSGIITTYDVKSALLITNVVGHSNLYALAISSGSGTGLTGTAPTHGAGVTLRINYDQELVGLQSSVISRPSTALSYTEDPSTIYKVLSYTDEGNDTVIAEGNIGYNYININPYSTQGIGNISWNDRNYVGATQVGIINSGTTFNSLITYPVTFSAPANKTAQANGAQGTITAPVNLITITAASGIIHPGMIVTKTSGSAVIPTGTYVYWASSDNTQVRLSNSIYNLANSDHLLFSGIASTGTAHVNHLTGTVDYINITADGAGYETSTLSATISNPGGSNASVVASVQGIVGSNSMKITPLSAIESARIKTGLAASTPYYYYFGYQGVLYKITGYRDTSVTLANFAELQFVQASDGTSGLANEIMPIGSGNTMYGGIGAGQPASITVKISTLRATSHDMVDVGTGGYASSKIPNDLYGPPLQGPYPSQETKAIGKGVVYFVTTDQDGNFKVGNYFQVDQGHGTVSISAPISLTNVDGISFKRGDVLVSRFTIDSTMAQEATSNVPVEQAIVGYVNKRLGLDKNNSSNVGNLIGSGYLDLGGVQSMKGSINMGTDGSGSPVHKITNVYMSGTTESDVANKGWADLKLSRAGLLSIDNDGTTPRPEWGTMSGPLDLGMDPITGVNTATQATSKRYVDQRAQFSRLPDVSLTNPVNQDLVMFSSTTVPYNTASQYTVWSTTTQAVNVSLNTATITNTPTANAGGSDVSFTRVNNALTIKLVGGKGSNNPITDYHINNDAQIQQSKLLMTTATTAASAPTGGQRAQQASLGVAQFDSSYFTATSGWISMYLSNNLNPVTDNKFNVGTNASRWAGVYAVTGTFTNAVNITGSTNATSALTGALHVAGGVGIEKDLWIGGDLYVDGSQTIINSTAIQTGDKIIYLSTGSATSGSANNSGIAVGPTSGPYITFEYDGGYNWVNSGGLTVNSTANATNYNDNSGALVVKGGVGIVKDTYIGGTLKVIGHVTLEGVTSTGSTGTGRLVYNTDARLMGSTVIDTLSVGSGGLTVGSITDTGLTTNNGVVYVDNTGKLLTGSGFTYDGTTFTAPALTVTNNATVNGTLTSIKDFTVGNSKFTVTSSTGLISSLGGIAINTNKFTVDSSNGNTAVAGTLTVGSDFAINGTIFTVGGVSGDVNVHNGKFTIHGASGDTYVAAGFTATNIWGTLQTASQTNITGVGTLTAGSIGSGFTAIPNSALANSTISGVSLGSNLNDLTAGAGISFDSGSTYNGGSGKTIKLDTSANATFNTLTIGVAASSQGIIFSNGGVLIPSTNTNARQLTFAPESAVSNGVAGLVDFAVTNLSTAANGQASVYVRADNSGAKIQLLAANSNASTPVTNMGGLYGTSPNGMFLWENGSCLMQFLASGTGAASAYSGRSPDSVAQLTINGSRSNATAYNAATVTINGGLGVSGSIYSGADMYATTFHGVATSAQYADLAEKYLADADYAPGTVVVFGGDKEITISRQPMDTAVAGVISTNPAYQMNSGLEGGLYVALQGRVPCKVLGPINKGDLLVTSSYQGIATAYYNETSSGPQVGTVIGKALQAYDDPVNPGVIEVVVGRV